MAELDIASVFTRDSDPVDHRPVSPTDISQFIRLDQCQRYLRLQLHHRQWGPGFLEDYDVNRQTIPALLTRSGASFEEMVEAEVSAALPTTRLDADQRRLAHTLNNNDDIIRIACSLVPGETHVVFQPRLEAKVEGWRIRGDIDLLYLKREDNGDLQVMIADMKSSTASRIEHRLQVAIYDQMLGSILREGDVHHASIQLAILYRGPIEGTTAAESADPALLERQRADAWATIAVEHGLLERINDAHAYIRSVHDLLTGPESVARRVLDADFDAIPFHLTYKCDGCVFNEFCMKRSAETDDLSFLPHITEQDKTNLRKNSITRIPHVAELKIWQKSRKALTPAPGHETTCRELAVTWPVGKHLDELIHRAQGYVAWQENRFPEPSYIPHKGYGTLPYNGPDLHPNLVRVYIDAQHDYLHDRIYMLGALVVASNNGVEEPSRRRSIIRMTEKSPDSNEIEKELFLDWIRETLRAIVELAAPDEDGNPTAPIHLVFVNRFAQKQLLNGLGRYLNEILGATSLYDFITQMAAFDSPIASFLDGEIREQKNYPMVCQSLQSVAAYLKFDWNRDVPYRDLFRARMFDFWRRFDDADDADATPGIRGWYTGRARFNSQIPLEYAYAAWNELQPDANNPEALSYYTRATPELMTGFHARRLEAMEHIAKDFKGNRQTQLSAFTLPDLSTFEQRASSLAHALDEFVTIERFVDLAAWKGERLAPPEQRVLNGTSLIVRYIEEDQLPGIAEQNRENQRREELRVRYRAEYREAHPDAKQIRLPKEQREECAWDHAGTRYRLRLETANLDCSLDDALNLSGYKAGDRVVLAPRWSVDERLPQEERLPFTTTAKQLLYGPRVQLVDMEIDRDEQHHATRAWAVVEISGFGGRSDGRGFTFGSGPAGPMTPEEVYTLEDDPNDINGFWASKVTDGLTGGGENALYCFLTGQPTTMPIVPSPEGAAAQQRFMDGLEALLAIGAMYPFEASKHDFIGRHGDDPVLLVQGPPGTGKSFSTAYALLARIQGAMAAGASYRVLLSCKTHAATDVLLKNVREAQEVLRSLFGLHPEIMIRYFDRRLLDVPLFRQRPRGEVHEDITPFPKDMKAKDVIAEISTHRWCVTASTPGGIYSMVKDDLFGLNFIDCVVLDEASQMSIPEAIMATLPLEPDGRLIVVGDHRQMPPIISHDWANEARRTFQEFKSYESLFVALMELSPPKINFEESFRLHADLAEFLRKEIYQQDNIDYHSNITKILPRFPHDDAFVDAVLRPEHPLVVVVHDEVGSQQRNTFEQGLMAPVLAALADISTYALTPEVGLGVVVPHRAQRAGLQDSVEELSRFDPKTGVRTISAVDTVERFQGDERTVIMIGATESDPEYILMTGDFLLDPRRLTVALSRAKQKMILVASRSIFEVFSADEETFANAQMWKNLLHDTCTRDLWEGTIDGYHVEVWGNLSSRSQ